MQNEYTLGVDLGGTKTNIAKGTADGDVLDIRRFVIDHTNHDRLVAQMLDAIGVYLSENCKNDTRPARIGMGIKGYVDHHEGAWKGCITIPDFQPIALADMVYTRYGIPTVIDNDVHAATLAELYYGAGRKYRDFIYYNIGTGISIGIVTDGRLLRGSTNYSGEIGHMVTESDGAPCPCGHFGCLEEVSSGAAIIAHARAGLQAHPDSLLRCPAEQGTLTSHTVFSLAEQGDALAAAIAERALKSICLSVIAILNIFNPEAILFGGGVMRDGWLLPKIRDYAYRYPLPPAARALKEVALSELGADSVGVMGAAAVGWESLFKA